MPFHAVRTTLNRRDTIILGWTAGNLERLRTRRSRTILVDGAAVVVVRPGAPEPPVTAVVVDMTDEALSDLVADGLVEFSASGLSIVCVFGRIPKLAGEAVKRVVGDA